MSTLNKIVVLLLSLLILGCSIDNNGNTGQGNVELKISRISPKLMQSLTGSQTESRAFSYMDRVKITTIQETVENSQTFNLNDTDTIKLYLTEGDYKLRAEVYNDHVDTENSVVSGEVDITVIKGQNIYPVISLIPTSPESFVEKEEIEISNIIHTEMTYIDHWVHDYDDQWKNVGKLEVINHGSEHWYTFKPENALVKFEVLTESLTYTPAVLSIYDSQGKQINSSTRIYNKFTAVLDASRNYYISVIPFKVIFEDREIFEESVKFTVESFADSDNNTSTADAIPLNDLEEIEAIYDGIGDVSDFYKLDVKSGDLIQYGTSGNLNISFSGDFHTISSNEIEIYKDGTLYIEVFYNTNESGTFSLTSIPIVDDGNSSYDDAILLSAYNDIEAQYSGRGDYSDFYKLEVKTGDIIDYSYVDSIWLSFDGIYNNLGNNQLEATADGIIYIEVQFFYQQNGFFTIKIKDPLLTNALVDQNAYQPYKSDGSTLTTTVGTNGELIVNCDMSADPIEHPYANLAIHRVLKDENGDITATNFDLSNLRSMVFTYETTHSIRVTLKDDDVNHTGFSYQLSPTTTKTTVEIKLADFILDSWSSTPRQLDLNNVLDLVVGIPEKVQGEFTIYELYAY